MSVTSNGVKFSGGVIQYTRDTPSAGKCRFTLIISQIHLENNSTGSRYAWFKVVDFDNKTLRNWSFKKLTPNASSSFGTATCTVTYDKASTSKQKQFVVLVYGSSSSTPPSNIGTALETATGTIPALATINIYYRIPKVNGTGVIIKTQQKKEATLAEYAKPISCDYFDDDAILLRRFNWWYQAGSPDKKHMPNEEFTVPYLSSGSLVIYADISPPMYAKTEDNGWIMGCPYVKVNGEWVKPTDIKGKVSGEWLTARKDII